MASRIGHLIQDQNINVHYNVPVGGKTNAVKAQKKAGLGGRKPLGDLSNSAKPGITEAVKMQKAKNIPIVEEVSAYSKKATDRKNVSKASNKVQTGNRKALSDNSNSMKPQLQKVQGMKLGILEGKLDIPESTIEEQFQHNHQECIKMQNKAMSKKEFLMTVGLDNGEIASPRAPRFPVKLEHDWTLDLKEMPEFLIDIYSSKKLPNSPPLSAPNSPKYSSFWKECEDINFELMESPCNSP